MGLFQNLFGKKGDSYVNRARKESGNSLAMPLTAQQRAKLDQGESLKRMALQDAGVDVGALTDEKLLDDARTVANKICHAGVRSVKKPERLAITWSNLTKTGKVPKKVAESLVTFEYKNGDFDVIHVWYTKDLSYYAADVYLWKGNDSHRFNIRTVDGELAIQHEGKLDAETGYDEHIR